MEATTSTGAKEGADTKARLGGLVIAVWIPCLLVVLGSLMVGHWVPLPKPERSDARLATALAELRAAEGLQGWTAYHVLYAACPCSRRVLEHVATSERPAELAEVVLLVGEDPAFVRRCEARRLTVVPLDAQQLEQGFGICASPLLIVTAPDGAIAYAGGYTDRKQGLDHRDLAIVADLRAGRFVTPLPVYGCGVSRSLQEALDPLGIKY